MRFITKIIFVLSLMFLLLSGCSSHLSSNNTSSQVVSLTPTDDTDEINVPSEESTKPSSTQTPFQTPKPILSSDDATNFIIHSLDSDCVLPCFFGITPGISSCREVISFFDEVSSVVSRNWLENSGESGSVALSLPTNGIVFSFEYHYDEEIVDYVYVQTSKMDASSSGEADYNDPEYFATMRKVTLESILETFGSPDEILIKSYSISPTWFRSHILLYYPEYGLLMDYESENDLLIIDDEHWVTTCPSEGFINFRLFVPGDNITLAELLEPYDNIENYQALSEASILSVAEFMEIFSSSGHACNNEVKTLMSLWPEDY